MFRHRAITSAFFDDAPHISVARQQLPATPMEVWAVLEDAEAWTVWLGLNRVTWTSQLGPDAARTIRNGPAVIDEQFFVWEPGEVMSFYFAKSPLPLKAMGEEYRLVDNGDGTTELVWTVAAEGMLPIFGKLMIMQLTRLARTSTPKLATLMAQRTA